MNRETFIEEIVDHLLTSVDPKILAQMASSGRESKRFDWLGLDIDFASFAGGQNLKDTGVALYVLLSAEQKVEMRDTFANRYRGMIREFIDLKEKILNHEYFLDSDLRSEIVSYVQQTDRALGNAIYSIAANRSVTHPSTFRYETRSSEPFDFLGPSESNHRTSETHKNISLTSNQCNQRFSDVKTSDKGMIQLSGPGEPFVFEARYISDVLPCHKSEKQNDFAPIFDLVQLFAGKSLPQKSIYTAIRMKGKYNGINFINVEFDTALPKLKEAIRISNSIQNKRDGEFK